MKIENNCNLTRDLSLDELLKVEGGSIEVGVAVLLAIWGLCYDMGKSGQSGYSHSYGGAGGSW